MFSLRSSLLLPLLILVACGGSSSNFPAGEAGARELIEAFKKGPDRAALVTSLKPSRADLEALFDASAVEAASAYVEKAYSQVGSIDLKPAQTESIVFSATTEDFLKESEAARKFPGGYGQVAKKLKPGVTWYAWKFVEPGQTSGMAFDGLAHVNGRWVFVPKPFRALRD